MPMVLTAYYNKLGNCMHHFASVGKDGPKLTETIIIITPIQAHIDMRSRYVSF